MGAPSGSPLNGVLSMRIRIDGASGIDMAASKATKPKRQQKAELELDPDAWPRFEQFIKDVVKAGSQHRVNPTKTQTASKGRVRKGKSRA
jgi:hypothetical protein